MALACVGLLGPAPGWAEPDTGPSPEERRGEAIYRDGAGASDAGITAVMGPSRVEVPARVMTCAKCHGDDGRGRSEGGVVSPDIRWATLTKPYALDQGRGEPRRPYTPTLLKRAVTMGLDSAGNELDPVMPRYRMSLQDADDLVLYLRSLGERSEVGIAEDRIRLGTLLPPGDVLPELRAAIETALEAYFDSVNRNGGVFGRRLELSVGTIPLSPAMRDAAITAYLDRERPFALLGAFTAGAESQTATLLDSLQVPLVGPIALDVPRVGRRQGYSFYLYPGLLGQSEALISFARERDLGSRPGAVVAIDDPPWSEVAAHARDAAARMEWNAFELVSVSAEGFDPSALAQRLHGHGYATLVLAMPGPSVAALVQAISRRGYRPDVCVFGTFAGTELMRSPDLPGMPLYLSFPSLPRDPARVDQAVSAEFLAAHDLPPGPRSVQLAVLSGARIMVEALTRVGRELTRAQLIRALESLYRFPTGFGPPISYGPGRRVGSGGAYVVSLQAPGAEGEPTPHWVDLAQ